MSRSKRTRLSVVACAASFFCLAASAALAGEITGNGKSLKNPDGTLNGRSICCLFGTTGQLCRRRRFLQAYVHAELGAGLQGHQGCDPRPRRFVQSDAKRGRAVRRKTGLDP